MVVSSPHNNTLIFSVSSSIDIEAFSSDICDMSIIFILELFEPVSSLAFKFELSISATSIDSNSLGLFLVCNNISGVRIEFEELIEASVFALNHKSAVISKSEISMTSHSVDNIECLSIFESIVNLCVWINILDIPFLIVVVVSSPDNYLFTFSISSSVDIEAFTS